MKLRLPRDLRGFTFDGVCPIELNNFDVDLVLPSLFFRVVTGGQDRFRMVNKPELIREHVRKLANHPDVLGVASESEFRVFERVVRSTLLHIGRKGQSKRVEQIEGLQDYTILTFKPGFPVHRSHIRRVDGLLYRMLVESLRGEQATREFFYDIFGRGVMIEHGRDPDGRYDGETDLDTLSRLSVAFMDVFESTGRRTANERQFRETLPSTANEISKSLHRFMTTYSCRMPPEAFTYHLKALINFLLFVYTQKLYVATIELVRNPDTIPLAMHPSLQYSPPAMYADFTSGTNSLSKQIAKFCVRRDLEMAQDFIPANLRLRQIDRYLGRNVPRRVKSRIDEVVQTSGTGPEYLQSLLHALDDPVVLSHIDARAAFDEERIREENLSEEHGEQEEAALDSFIERVTFGSDSSFDRLISLITHAQETTISTQVTSWYRDSGGLNKEFGLLNGVKTSRQSWHYAPSSDLLAVLVQLAAISHTGWTPEQSDPEPISLNYFLNWLEERFGVLVDQPPDDLVGAEYAAAAKENLQWMLRRLKQMGIFRDLSDDFTVQRLTPPYMHARAEEVRV
jgi:hypothetical protein